MNDELTIEYVCPLTREECINVKEPRENPFTGSQIHEQCAFGTKDGACSIARLISSMTSYFANERW